MKRFWLAMLSLGLVLAFSAQAFAVDVKFSGSFYAAGMYLDKVTLKDKIGNVPASAGDDPQNGTSTAFYYQRLRVQTDFIVSPGLKLVTRFDAMERIWGGARGPATNAVDSAGTRAENENIAFDLVYIDYVSPIGTFDVGYQIDGVWGTSFMDSSVPAGVIAWNYVAGPWKFIVKVIKLTDNSNSYTAPAVTTTDLDSDKYAAAIKYTWKDGEAGLLAGYGRNATTKRAAPGYLGQSYGLHPYAKAQIGPVKIQAEVNYMWGDSKKYESDTGMATDIALENLGIFVDAVADFRMVYVGGTFAYVSGDDPGTTDKAEGGAVSGGRDWDPCLIMFNQERTYWTNALGGYNPTTNASPMSNAWFFQGRVGVKPITALDIVASVSFANADKKPAWPAIYTPALAPGTGVLNNAYGWELDLTGTYKITNNLSYMLGGGYLWTGDYYQGISQEQGLNNNYLLINKLTLTF